MLAHLVMSGGQCPSWRWKCSLCISRPLCVTNGVLGSGEAVDGVHRVAHHLQIRPCAIWPHGQDSFWTGW